MVGGLLVSQLLTLVYHAGDLSMVRSPGPARLGPAGREAAEAREARAASWHEPLGALYSSAGRDHAADHRDRAGGCLAFLLLAGSPLPQVDFPTISVRPRLPGASPETMAATVATPLERPFGRIAGVTEMTSTQFAGLYPDHPAVRSGSRHQRRRPRCAGGDQCRRSLLPGRTAEQSDLPQGESGRLADPDSGADLRNLRAAARCTTSASTILAQKLSQVRGVGQVTVGGGSLPAVRVELNPHGA